MSASASIRPRRILTRARVGQLCVVRVGGGLRLARVVRQRGGAVVEAALTDRTLAERDLTGDVMILGTPAHPFDNAGAWDTYQSIAFASLDEARAMLAPFLRPVPRPRPRP